MRRVRAASLDHLVLLDEGLRDAELAAIALGVSVAEADGWLTARGRGANRRRFGRFERKQTAFRLLVERLADRPSGPPVVSDVASAVALLAPHLASLEVEELHVVGLDSRNRVLVRARIARGAANQVMATAREVFRPLIAAGALSAIVAHNHPSGDPTPSEADGELTARLGIAGELLGIPLVDHLVLAQGGHHSFAEAGTGLVRPGRRRAPFSRASGKCWTGDRHSLG